MSERGSFFRKVLYGIAIAVLLIPLALLSRPASLRDEGGKLARLRNDPEHPISQASLGQIDPGSEAMRLATLGLRGVAVNLLWEKANTYKMKEDWTNLTATLEQLAKLQPNFITFWKYQAWNLTYNVSVEFDDYHDRYYYVRRGIEFLKEGEQYNQDNPHLLWDLGWFHGQKIGRADEHVQYRRLFKLDDDYHRDRPDRSQDERDNWLVGKEWYLQGVDAVDNKGKSIDRKPPRLFFSSPAMSQMNYSEAIEEEGFFDKAQRAWVRAEQEWEGFGDREIPHSTGIVLKLGDQPRLEAEVARLEGELDAFAPGTRDQVVAEKRAKLTDDERAALDTPFENRTPAQIELAYHTQEKLEVTHREVAEAVAKSHPEHANQAQQLASTLERVALKLRYTVNYKNDSNYDYWLTRAQLEQTQNARDAREAMFRAARIFREGDLVTAKKVYEEGFAKWRLVYDEFPFMLDSGTATGDFMIDYFIRYRDVLDQLDEALDERFPLWDVLEQFDLEQKFKDELEQHRQRTGGGSDTSSPENAPDPA